MIDISQIIDAIDADRVRISDHAVDEANNDDLKFDEVYFSVQHGEIIEQYPKDKPYPSCLIFGNTFSGDPVHSVWAYNEQNQWVVLITVYRPNPRLWIDYRIRRKKS